jgi:hypothetical protein
VTSAPVACCWAHNHRSSQCPRCVHLVRPHSAAERTRLWRDQGKRQQAHGLWLILRHPTFSFCVKFCKQFRKLKVRYLKRPTAQAHRIDASRSRGRSPGNGPRGETARMSGVRFNIGSDRLPVRARIFGEFAVVLVLLGTLAAMTLRGAGIVETQSHHVEDSGKVAARMSGFVRQAEEARTRVIEYALSENDGDLQRAQQSLALLREAAATLKMVEGSSERRRASLIQITEDQTRYGAAVDEMIQAIGDRRKHAATLGKAATDAQTIVSAIATALVREKAASEVLEKGIRLMEGLHTSHAAAIRFLASRNPADAAAAGSELAAMQRALDSLKADINESRRTQRFVHALAEPIGQFEQALSGLVATTDRIVAAAALPETTGSALLDAASCDGCPDPGRAEGCGGCDAGGGSVVARSRTHHVGRGIGDRRRAGMADWQRDFKADLAHHCVHAATCGRQS